MVAEKALIRGGLIADGSGNEPYIGDVLIEGGLIADIGNIGDAAGAVVYDAAGQYVTPGFVDVHRHIDYAALKPGFGDIELAQGITTAVGGSCGMTAFPQPCPELADTLAPVLGEPPCEIASFAAYADLLRAKPLPINIGMLIGSCAVRAHVKGFADTPFTAGELGAARRIVREAAERGALGVSLGVMYRPEFYSTAEEMAAVCSAGKPGVITAHIRGEGDTLAASVAEAIDVAERADMPLEISHFKCCGVSNWGRGIYEAIALIDKARRTHDVTVDFYPYDGGATTLLSLIPPSFLKAAPAETPAYMETAEAPAALAAALARTYPAWDNYAQSLGYGRIILTGLSSPELAVFNGRTVAEVCDETGRPPAHALCRVLAAERGRAGVIVMSMSQADVDAVARLPYASVISDALYPADLANAHPRLYSAFPKILRDYVRERKLLTIGEAVRKMAAMPAERMSLKGRGKLAKGYHADVCVFDINAVKDNADFARSGLIAGGMGRVFVGGRLAWEAGKRGADNGKFIER